jgi:hypothetical protein
MAVAMCRAVKVLCVATDEESLAALKRATVGADWELATGATDASEAIAQLEDERPHVLVAFGPFADLIASARERLPAVRVVSDRDLPGTDVAVTSLDEVRDAILGRSRPGGPVRT